MHYFFLLIILFLGACGNKPAENLEEAPEARLVVAEKIMSPEQRAIENKIANRTLLQSVVDGSQKFQRTVLNYECSNQAGGILTFIKENETLKGIRFAATANGWNEFLSYYYNGNKLAFVVHEYGTWEANQEKDVQTLFYLDNNEVFRCMRKTAVGETAKIEQLIKEAEFEIINTDEDLFQYIKKQETVFQNNVTQSTITKLFCK